VVSVFAIDLGAGDVVLHGRRQVAVEMIARRADGMVRVKLGDGTVCTCPPDAPWEVARASDR
jgi:hypothetical protein